MTKQEFIEEYINNINNGTIRDLHVLSLQVNENSSLYDLSMRVVCYFCPLYKKCTELHEHSRNMGCGDVLKNYIEDFKEE